MWYLCRSSGAGDWGISRYSCPSAAMGGRRGAGGGGGGKSASHAGRGCAGGDGGGGGGSVGSWRNTSSSSGSRGWEEVKWMLDSEMRRKGRGVAGVETGLCHGDSAGNGSWRTGGGVFGAGSSEGGDPAGPGAGDARPPDPSRGKSFSVSSDVPLSAELLLATGGSRPWARTSMEAWDSRSLACEWEGLEGEKGQGRPTEAARPDMLCARWRSACRCFSLLVTGAFGCDAPRCDRYLSTRMGVAALSSGLRNTAHSQAQHLPLILLL